MTESPAPDAPPAIAPWVLSLRFGLELGSLVALGAWARRAAGPGPIGWAAATVLVLGAAALWGTFAVPGDPSRSGKASIRVSGAVRLAIEMAVFLGGALALGALEWWPWFDAFVAAFVVHQAGAVQRLQWLVRQK